MRFIFRSLVFILLLGGCVIEKTKHGLHIYRKGNEGQTPNGYLVAKPIKYHLQKTFRLFDTAVLSMSEVYSHECSEKSWFKFFPDGRVVYCKDCEIGVNQSQPDRARAGWYNIKGKNFIIEIPYTQNSYLWANLLLEGEIVGDTLKIYKDHYGKHGSNIHHFTDSKGDDHCRKFIRSTKQHFFLKPDW